MATIKQITNVFRLAASKKKEIKRVATFTGSTITRTITGRQRQTYNIKDMIRMRLKYYRLSLSLFFT